MLERVSLRLEPGEFVAILGPSGCGKSTLLRLVAGLDFPAAGFLSLDGQPIDGPDASRIIVFQDPTLYPWRTVWSNVALGLEARGLLRSHRGRVDDVLRLVGLTGFATAYPRQLSGGMSQRAALARALVSRFGMSGALHAYRRSEGRCTASRIDGRGAHFQRSGGNRL